MSKVRAGFWFLVAGGLLLGCAKEASTPPMPSGQVHANVYTTGQFNNRVTVHENAAFIVASGSNRVERVDLSSCTDEENSCTNGVNAVFETGSNPWNVTVGNTGKLYTSLWLGGPSGNGSIGIAGLEDGVVEGTIEGSGSDFLKPQGVISFNDKVYVSNSAVSYDENYNATWNEGFVTVIDEATGVVAEVVTLPFKNPAAITLYDGKLYVVCTGGTSFDENWNLQVDTEGGLVVLDPATNTVVDQVSLGLSAPGPNLTVLGQVAYVASSLAASLYKVDLTSLSVVHGLEDPIQLSTESSYISWVTTGPHGYYLYAASYKEDKVFVLDSGTDELVDVDDTTEEVDAFVVGPGGTTAKGPVALAPWKDAEGVGHMFVLNTLSNSLAEITLDN